MGEEAGFESIDFDAILAEIDRKEAGLKAAQRQLAAVSAKARSADGLVEVTVSPTGAVTAVTLAPETFRRSTPQYLGKSVVEAAQQATRQVRQSTKSAVAPIAEIGRELSEAVDEPRIPHSTNASATNENSGVEAASTDHTARVGVDALGIVAVVQISPNAYQGGTVGTLAAAITEAAERAARQMYETRMGAVESDIIPADLPEMDVFFPIPQVPDQDSPSAPQTPPVTPPPAPPVSVNRVIPGTRKPNRDQVVGPSDWDEDDGYGQPRQSWMV
ncbi:YbaB/EbfC family nucleoid-associated protein [Nocardia sp. CA2R105]|uniref:YbaB/EbfC family nucleoid-associated protein n=1 Tax=Nocardia coffeae TaxID=2873381 RepID=UPI001CA68FAF|nr:YbaB/EbfC family nucleoid-associated protein [Nocardia coffeae]MBY8857954.1 YbaB/EbfC family nucleoid-associated protein [Nocardia coffeae]